MERTRLAVVSHVPIWPTQVVKIGLVRLERTYEWAALGIAFGEKTWSESTQQLSLALIRFYHSI